MRVVCPKCGKDLKFYLECRHSIDHNIEFTSSDIKQNDVRFEIHTDTHEWDSWKIITGRVKCTNCKFELNNITIDNDDNDFDYVENAIDAFIEKVRQILAKT